MKRLQNLVCYFISNLSYAPGKTELIKLCYLFEHFHTLLYGEQYTNAHFVRYLYGPYTYDFDISVAELEQQGAISMVQSYYAEDKKTIQYCLQNRSLLSQYNIGEEKVHLAEYVLSEYAGLPLDDLLHEVYNTAPMSKIIQKEEGFRMGLMLREALGMKESNGTIKLSREELRAARARRNQQENRGTDKDYYAHLAAQYKEFEDLRRRSNECQV